MCGTAGSISLELLALTKKSSSQRDGDGDERERY